MAYFGDGSNLTGITASQISGSLGALTAVKFASISSEYNTSSTSFTAVPGLSTSFTANAGSMFFVNWRLIISGRTSDSGGTVNRSNYYVLRVYKNGSFSHDMHINSELMPTLNNYSSFSDHPYMDGIAQFELLGSGLRDISGWAQDSATSLYSANDTVVVQLYARRDIYGQGSNVANSNVVRVAGGSRLTVFQVEVT
jgi:hypothetical protein